jgi:hypothetical protein
MTTHLTTHDLIAYRVTPEPFWLAAQLAGDDGYDRIEIARARGWDAIPAWGRDGWDLGSWPLVVIFHRHRAGAYELAENVEGDATVWRFPTRELRDAATDLLAFTHWQHEGEDWVDGYATAADAPDHLRGPYSRDRTERET